MVHAHGAFPYSPVGEAGRFCPETFLMEIRVLGCAGAEFPGHNPPGFLVNGKILLDAGSLTTVLTEKEQYRIRNVFITHAHLDHVLGIPFLADNLIVRKGNSHVNVMGIRPSLRVIRRDLLNNAIWPDFTVIPNPEDAVLTLIELKEGRPVVMEACTCTVTPFRVNHSVPAVGYLVEDGTGGTLFYTGDTGPTDGTWEKLREKHINALIIEVSFPNRMEEMAIVAGHLTARLLRKELAKLGYLPERIYVTHPKPQYLETIRKELSRLRTRNLRLLKDGEILRT